MFSLIVVLISIALVAALALATLYYGGPALSDKQSQAEASRIHNEGQQVMGAAEMFYVNQGRWPDTVDELVTASYLKTIPQGATVASDARFQALMASAVAAASGWSAPIRGWPLYTTAKDVPSEVCSKFNKTARGDDGILRSAYTSITSQCFGGTGAYQVIVGKAVAMPYLEDAVGAGNAVIGPLPAKTAPGNVWDKRPDTDVGAPAVPGDGDNDAGNPPTPAQTPVTVNGSAFSTTSVGQSSTATVTVHNPNKMAVTVEGASVEGTYYSLENAQACPTIAANGDCTYTVRFTPLAPGPQPAVFAVSVRGTQYPTNLRAVGYAPAAVTSVAVSRGNLTTELTVTGVNFLENDISAYVTPANGLVTATFINSTQVRVTIQNNGDALSKVYLKIPSTQQEFFLGDVDARGQLEWTFNQWAAMVYSADRRTVTQPSVVNSEVITSRTHSTGKWYVEASYGRYGVITLTGGTAGNTRYLDGRWGNSGGSASVLVPSNSITGANARYGYAADTVAKTWSLIDLSNCKTVGKWSFPGVGAYALVFTTRSAHDGANNTATLYTSSAGATSCKPAGHDWW